jgi:hypothetical protein
LDGSSVQCQGVSLKGVRLAIALVWLGPRRPGPWQGLSVGDLAGHVGQLAARGPGRSAQVGERLLIIQAFAFHQRALSPLDQAPRVQGDLELLGQGPFELRLGRRAEQAGHNPGMVASCMTAGRPVVKASMQGPAANTSWLSSRVWARSSEALAHRSWPSMSTSPQPRPTGHRVPEVARSVVG